MMRTHGWAKSLSPCWPLLLWMQGLDHTSLSPVLRSIFLDLYFLMLCEIHLIEQEPSKQLMFSGVQI